AYPELIVLNVDRDPHGAVDTRPGAFDDARRRNIAGVGPAKDPDGAVAVVGDRNLVVLEVDVDCHGPVQPGPRPLDLADRRGVAMCVAGVDGNRRLVEAASHDRLAPFAGGAATPPRCCIA